QKEFFNGARLERQDRNGCCHKNEYQRGQRLTRDRCKQCRVQCLARLALESQSMAIHRSHEGRRRPRCLDQNGGYGSPVDSRLVYRQQHADPDNRIHVEGHRQDDGNGHDGRNAGNGTKDDADNHTDNNPDNGTDGQDGRKSCQYVVDLIGFPGGSEKIEGRQIDTQECPGAIVQPKGNDQRQDADVQPASWMLAIKDPGNKKHDNQGRDQKTQMGQHQPISDNGSDIQQDAGKPLNVDLVILRCWRFGDQFFQGGPGNGQRQDQDQYRNGAR